MFSVLPPATDIRQHGWHVGSGPIPVLSRPVIRSPRRRGRESIGGTSRPSALAVLRLTTSWYLDACCHRQVGRIGAFENFVDVEGRTANQVEDVR
jgi:hypothetical protein